MRYKLPFIILFLVLGTNLLAGKKKTTPASTKTTTESKKSKKSNSTSQIESPSKEKKKSTSSKDKKESKDSKKVANLDTKHLFQKGHNLGALNFHKQEKKEKHSQSHKKPLKSVAHSKIKPKSKAASLVPLPEMETKTPYDELTYRDSDYILTIRAKSFHQGNMAFMKLESNTPNCKLDINKYKVKWRGVNAILHPYDDYHIVLMPMHPDEKPGVYHLEIEKTEETKIITKKFPITVERTNFPERRMYSLLRVPKKFGKGYSEETLAFIKKCEEKKQEVFNIESELKLNGKFVKPLEKIYITSPFYVKRFYRPGKARPHGGTDLRGKVGEPIYAMQTGKVVISERMFFEGIFTVIDHGSKMFSLYMHQSKSFVKEGDLVKKGTLIGEVGSTGMSTGPHLHLGLKVDGIMVNPLSVVDQALF